MDELIKLFGPFDENIKVVCETFNVKVTMQDGQCNVFGEDGDVNSALGVLNKLLSFIRNGETPDIGRVNYICGCAKDGRLEEVDQLLNDVVTITSRGKPIKSKTVGQKKYVDLMKKKTITFGIGPAGTGKTYLAVALAVNAYRAKQVEKIILTRPAVEAGEKLGFLPGDLQEKVNPYLRPLYDALQEMLGVETYAKMMERGTIEIAPLAYMRGRTLSNAYVILDEAQNTTKEQIKMFLTRLGENSKMVITGDLTQTDLPDGKTSGLKHAIRILRDIDDIGIIRLSEKDVVRHPLVQQIVKAYETQEEK
ncbi:MAG: PhoH family protein [Clostridia bacterium]|nr:PhoH family protein [Clostridia bacterium]MBQ3067020.1 PhoH family protein [Clostridia bacterium]MBR2966849.1 PhoH family protein [Clostridia bacterium]